MIFNHVESLHRSLKVSFTRFKKFRVVENSFPIAAKLHKINTKEKVKSISTFELTTFYTTIPHNLFIKVSSEVTYCVFKLKTRSLIGFSKPAIY